MHLLALRKRGDEGYVDFYRRVESAYAKVHRITPKNQTAEECGQELTLFTILSGLEHDDPLRRSLTAQRSLVLDDAFSAFLRTDAGEQARESANAAFSGGRCFAMRPATSRMTVLTVRPSAILSPGEMVTPTTPITAIVGASPSPAAPAAVPLAGVGRRTSPLPWTPMPALRVPALPPPRPSAGCPHKRPLGWLLSFLRRRHASLTTGSAIQGPPAR
jgi:hypothetical protein